MGSLTPNRLKARNHPRDFVPIGFAWCGFAAMLMQMDVENSFTYRAAMIHGMHSPGDGLAVDSSTNFGIVNVVTIRDGVIPREKDQHVAAGEAAQATGYESYSLCCKAMTTLQVAHDFAVQSAQQLELDGHLSFAKPLRWAIRSCGNVGFANSTRHEKANQFLSTILALLTFQLRV